MVLVDMRRDQRSAGDRVLDDRDHPVRRRAGDLRDRPRRFPPGRPSRPRARRGSGCRWPCAASSSRTSTLSAHVCASISEASHRGRGSSILSLHMGEQRKRPTPRAYRMGRRREQLDAMSRRIAEAAFELHATVGPAQTSISAVAERAGVQRHTVYHHFPDLTSLMRACTEHGMRVTRTPRRRPGGPSRTRRSAFATASASCTATTEPTRDCSVTSSATCRSWATRWRPRRSSSVWESCSAPSPTAGRETRRRNGSGWRRSATPWPTTRGGR